MALFQRRHYEAIARKLRVRVLKDEEPVRQCALDLAELFEEDNPRFDRVRFETAVGLRP